MSAPIMVMGCTSDAGKSFLVTALCRHFANQGLSVAPFKAQNMSNNAAVTASGDEIGRAQYLQALAARVEPDARMNPVLVKPTSDTSGQVIVMGRYHPRATETAWLDRKELLWPMVCEALHSLIANYDRVVIEGAGSPAEINLREREIVNMSVALECNADVFIASDIDRGGSFAHLLGTYMSLNNDEKATVKGFLLNRFRGDEALLGNAMDWLEERTGVPTVAIVPYTRHRLPEEDTLHHRSRPVSGQVNIALLAYPWASNLDEFDPLIHEASVNVVPLRDREPLDRFDAIILPGSKNSVGSLRYFRKSGLAAEVVAAARQGTLVLGVCGGLQILGREIRDPDGLEGGDDEGLGLLDLRTTLAAEKVTRQRKVGWVEGGDVSGYEIRHGITEAGAGVSRLLADDTGWQQQNVMGVYLHGLAEDTAWRQWFLDRLGWRGQTSDWHATLDREIERVAKLVVTSGWAKVLS